MCLIWKLNRPVTMKRSTVGLKISVLFFCTIHFVTSVCSCTSDWDSYCSGCNKWSFICGFVNHYKKMQRYGHVICFTLFPLSNSAGSKTSKNNQQQQTPEFTMNNNPVYVVHKLSQFVSLTQQQHQHQQQESVFDMDHNPLYTLNSRPQHTNNNPSAGHEYETVQPVRQ